MAVRYTEEQLNTVDKSLLIQMFLNQQEQLETLTAEVRSLNEKMQLMMEQMVLANRNRFGRSSEKMEDASQISFMEVDGTIVFFNEAEAVCNLDAPEAEQLEVPTLHPVKKKGKKEQDMSGLPIERVDHYMTEEELTAEFGKNGWKQLPDAISRRYRFVPAKVEVEEHQHRSLFRQKGRTHGKGKTSQRTAPWKYRFHDACGSHYKRQICQCHSALPPGTGIQALWISHHQTEHGKLDDPSRRGIPFCSLRLSPPETV